MKYALIPLLPFIAFVVIGLFGHWIRERAHWVAVPAVIGSFLLSLGTFSDVTQGEPIRFTLYSWISSGNFQVPIGFYIDRLAAAMLLLVTTVSGLVHIYTIGYMRGDGGYARFFSYIALFTFSMLMLVMADNFLQLYVFWEAVGLSYYSPRIGPLQFEAGARLAFINPAERVLTSPGGCGVSNRTEPHCNAYIKESLKTLDTIFFPSYSPDSSCGPRVFRTAVVCFLMLPGCGPHKRCVLRAGSGIRSRSEAASDCIGSRSNAQ